MGAHLLAGEPLNLEGRLDRIAGAPGGRVVEERGPQPNDAVANHLVEDPAVAEHDAHRFFRPVVDERADALRALEYLLRRCG